jgi:hypothetical protein
VSEIPRPPKVQANREPSAAILASFLVAAVTAAPAKAQDVLVGNPNLFPQRTVGVQDRPRPEYDPLGFRIGAFQLSPSLTVEESYDDNIYATDRNSVSDFLTATTGAVSVQTLGTGFSLSAKGAFTANEYRHNSVEDFLDYNGSVGAGDLLGYSTTISASGQFAHAHVSRQDPSFPGEAITPPSFDTSGGSIDIRHNLAHGNIDLNLQLLSFNFHDAELSDHILLAQDFKDHNEITLDLRDNFVVGQSVSTFLRAIHKEYDYGHDAQAGLLNRNSAADTAGGGVSFQITNLMTGEIGAGVLRLKNHDAVDNNLTTVSVLSTLEYFVTPLTTVTATFERASGAANIPGSSSFISNNAKATLDYELRRNVILSATFSRDSRLYTGIDATETTLQGGATARWLLNRSLKLQMAYTVASRTSPLQTYLGQNFNDRVIDFEIELAR